MSSLSKNAVRIRYDGPLLKTHSMDVSVLAPSLLALADLCKNANQTLNGDKSSVKVLVNANVEQNCFELSFDLVMTLYEQTRVIVGMDDVKTAKQILETIGILIVGPSAGIFGLIKAVKKIKDKTTDQIKFEHHESGDQVSVTIIGDNNQVEVFKILPDTYKLLKSASNIKSVQKLVEPLSMAGYDTLEFETEGLIGERITKDDAKDILKADPELAESLGENEEAQIITAWVKVFAPVYEKDAEKWRFVYNGGHEYMDISETDIAEQAMRRGGVLVDDSYKVKLELVQSKVTTKIAYKIKRVLEFHPAKFHNQPDLFADKDK